MTLPSGGIFFWDYDLSGNLLNLKDMYDNNIRSYTYYPDGSVETYTDRFGTVTYSNYDSAGNPQTITDIFGVPAQLTYDSNGNLTQRIERGVTMTFAYDEAGRPTRKDWGNGTTVDYEYRYNAPDWTAIQGPTFGRVERTFNATGKLGAWKLPNGDTFTRTYDLRRSPTRRNRRSGQPNRVRL